MATTETRIVAPVVETTHSPFARLHPISVTDVRLQDTFWEPRRTINRTETLTQQLDQCERTGRIDNFRRAAGVLDVPFQGRYFNDSDVYKWVEAAAWSLATDPDPALARQLDEVVATIAAAQDADGYLNTYFTFGRAAERWTDLRLLHELYCAGHLIQAAVAHRRATGSNALLAVAERVAENMASVFGPTKRAGTDGHPEIELALVELYRETGDERWLQQAAFFLDMRGREPSALGGEPARARPASFYQDHLPVREQHDAVGHSVRALYLYSGMTDLYLETGDSALRQTLTTLWESLQQRRVYVTGGAGSRHEGEAFGEDYELPAEVAYAETCAAIAHVMWAWRMLLATGDAQYADALEIALYNGVLSGLALDGKTYFYVNPLADRGEHRRQPWYGTACCPPNLARTLASLPGYMATTSAEGVWVHLFATADLHVAVPGGEAALRVETAYPWRGDVTVTVMDAPDGPWTLYLRVPKWAEGETITLDVNGVASGNTPVAGSYAAMHRPWSPGDTVHLSLPMTMRATASHPRLRENAGRIAFMRGPLVYCAEGADHPGTDVWNIAVRPDATWKTEWRDDLGGIVAANTEASGTGVLSDVPLYFPIAQGEAGAGIVSLTLIPYYAWANREPGPMEIWLRCAR